MENTLRSLAKRYKSVKYSLGLVLIFLMLGINAFSEEIFTTEQVSTSKKDIKASVENLKDKVEQVKEKNEKDIKCPLTVPEEKKANRAEGLIL